MGAPTGESFVVGGVEYIIHPRVSSTKTLNAVRRAIKRIRRTNALDALRDLEAMAKAKELTDAEWATLGEAARAEVVNPVEVSEGDAWSYLATRDGTAIVLSECCDNIPSGARALEIMAQAEEEGMKWFDISALVFKASGIIEAKNSDPPSNASEGETRPIPLEAEETPTMMRPSILG